jgi:hypothetical protein
LAGLTVAEFAAYVEDLPSRSPCWGDGIAGLYPVLAWLNTHPAVVQREVIEAEGALCGVMSTTRAHHNQVGTAVAWATQFMVGPPRPTGTDPDDLLQLFDLAGHAYVLRNLLAEVRQGVRRFEADGPRIVMTFVGDPRLDTLDRLLAMFDDLTGGQESPEWDPRLRGWFQEHADGVPWQESPRWVQREFRDTAKSLIEGYPSYLSATLDVGGFTIADATEVLVELLARGLHMQSWTINGSTSVPATVPAILVEVLLHDLSDSIGVPVERVRPITDLLTLDLARCPDPCLTPLIPLGAEFPHGEGFVVPMSSLIVPSSPMRNFTALLQVDPARFGRAGRELGALGARTVAETLRRLSGALVATGVQVVRPDRSRAGDLDVVACDPVSGTLAIFEILWRIGPDGSREVAAVEEAAHAKREQVARVRDDLANARAMPRWPSHWPDVGGFVTRWFILTPNVSPVRRVDPAGTIVRSHQMLEGMLRPGSSVIDLIELMDEPHYPPPELWDTHWVELQYGEYRIRFDVTNATPGTVPPGA